MKVIPTAIPDVLLIEPRIFGDQRGFFFESYNQRAFAEIGIPDNFVQDNHSKSNRGVLRGLHYQMANPQGKLVRVGSGEIFDVAVDMRRSSPTFGHWVGQRLSAENRKMLWVPPKFAHGFVVLSETAELLYKATDFYNPSAERSLLWNDPELGIDWQFEGTPILSDKDKLGTVLAQADFYE